MPVHKRKYLAENGEKISPISRLAQSTEALQHSLFRGKRNWRNLASALD